MKYGYITKSRGNSCSAFYLSLTYVDETRGVYIHREQGFNGYSIREAVRMIKAAAGVTGKHGITLEF